MIGHTAAFAKMKQAMQSDLDTVLMLCHAVPALNGYIKAVENPNDPVTKLPDPHHFEVPQPLPRLKALMPRYRKVLGRLVYMAGFTYFEDYFKSMLDEVAAFHGGWEVWESRARGFVAERSQLPTEDQRRELAKLQEPRKKAWSDRYANAHRALLQVPFAWPHHQLGPWAISQLRIARSDFKANDVPPIARDALGVPLTDADVAGFRAIQAKRNSIAHQGVSEIELREGIDAGKALRDLAIKIDKHVCERLLVIEPK